MALSSTDHFHEFLARIVPDENGNTVAGMHLIQMRTIMDGETIIAQQMQPAIPVTWTALTAAMSTPNLEALKAAVDAELAARA
jgi:hypothetical protein